MQNINILVLFLTLSHAILTSAGIACGPYACGTNNLCCNDETLGPVCYDPLGYGCTPNKLGYDVLCSIVDFPCGTVCYDPLTYVCNPGNTLVYVPHLTYNNRTQFIAALTPNNDYFVDTFPDSPNWVDLASVTSGGDGFLYTATAPDPPGLLYYPTYNALNSYWGDLQIVFSGPKLPNAFGGYIYQIFDLDTFVPATITIVVNGDYIFTIPAPTPTSFWGVILDGQTINTLFISFGINDYATSEAEELCLAVVDAIYGLTNEALH